MPNFLSLGEEDFITFEVSWHALTDACPRCRELDGEVWMFPQLTGTLTHPSFGAVYDLDADISLTHPNCRCYLEITPVIELEKTDFYQNLEKDFQEVRMDMPSNVREATAQVEKLRVNVGQVRSELREMEYILYRTMSVLNRMGLSPEVSEAIQRIERLILIVRILHSAMVYLEAGTPLGWILGIISGFSALVSVTDLTMEMTK